MTATRITNVSESRQINQYPMGTKFLVINNRKEHLRPCTLCSFLSNLSRNAVARQVAGELHSVTINMGCLAILLLHEALHEVDLALLVATDCSNWRLVSQF